MSEGDGGDPTPEAASTDGAEQADGRRGDGDRPAPPDDPPVDEGWYVDHHDFLSWIGLEIPEAEAGRVVMRLPYDEKLANLDGNGTIHGGIVAAVIDTASGHVLRSTFEDPYAVEMATVDLNVSYVRPARSDLTATATVVRAGESMGVTEVTVEGTAPDGETKTVAVGRTTYRLFRDG